MKYQFIAMQQQDYPITILCRVLQISQSGYYAWRQRAPSPRSQEDAQLSERIERLYHANRQVYGSPRIHAALRADGQPCGKKRVARLMRDCGLSAKRPRHRTRTTDSQHTHPVAENVLGRDFTATAPNTKWVADITGVALSRGGPGPVLSHDRRMGHGCASGSRSGGKRLADGAGASAS